VTPRKSSLLLPTNRYCGSSGADNLDQVDAFGNKIDARQIEAVLAPVPEEGTLFDGKPVGADGKIVLTTRPHSIQITKAGSYSITAANGKAQVSIVAARANVLDVVCPDKVVAGETLALKLSLRDAYGNPAKFEGPLKIEAV
jgi:hypothetical protein